MSNTVITHTFILDSADRDLDQYPTTNDYRVPLGKTLNGVVGFRVLDCKLNQTEHSVNAANNVLIYRVGSGGAGVRRIVTVDPGAYTPSELATAIQTQLTSHGDGMTITYSASTQRITFSAGGEFVIYVRDSTMRHVLGFSTTAYSVSSSSNTITPDGIVDVTLTPYVLVEVPDFQDDVAGVVVFDSPNRFTAPSSKYFDTFRSKISSIRFKLMTRGGRLYDTGRANHVFIVAITTMDTKRLDFNTKFEPIV